MATKKVKRYNGEDESMVDQDAADQEATSMMKRAMDEGERDEKALPADYKVEAEAPAKAAPVARKPVTPKPSGVKATNLRGVENAMADSSNKERYRATLSEGEKGAAGRRAAVANFFTPSGRRSGSATQDAAKASMEKDSSNRSALRDSEKPAKTISKEMASPRRVNATMSSRFEPEKPKFRASQGYASGGSVSASRRADGIATKGKTRGKIC